jgi:Predicted hydrocarbon binding protein (contains V4R domain)
VLDVVGRRGHLSLRNSVFALEAGAAQGKRVCYMFEGFVTGAFRYLLEDSAPASTVTCREAQCVAEGNHEHCRFDVEAGPS